MHPLPRLLFAASLLTLAACQTKGSKWNNPRDEAAFHPANLTGGGTRPMPTGTAVADPGKPGASLDAMLGQVNGKPLYAGQILAPIEPQLMRLGQDLERRAFTEEAGKLISGELISAIRRAQMLTKAEAYLKDGQRNGLDSIVERHREELLRQYGEGSLALAEANFSRERGLTLKQELREFREKQVVNYYMFEKVNPLVNVTRRDIERFYNDHFADYNKQEMRKIRLIQASSPLAGMTVATQLSQGKPFEQVAANTEWNRFNPGQGGAWADSIEGAPNLRIPELNKAIAGLKTKDAWSGPILDAKQNTWFVGLTAYAPPAARPLDDVQLEIRAILDQAQRTKFTNQVYAKAAQEGSCSDVGQMVEALLAITVSRYAAH